jgi:hypothetical protein
MPAMKTMLTAVLFTVLMTGYAYPQVDTSGFEVRLTYLPASQDIGDYYEDYLNEHSRYVEYDVFVLPVGISLAYRWDMAQLLPGAFAYADFGPAMIMVGDATFWMPPFGGGVGYELSMESGIGCYGKLGLRMPFAGGDNVDDTSTGILAAVGLQFGGSDDLVWLVEAASDSSEISFTGKDIDLGFMLSVGLKFR